MKLTNSVICTSLIMLCGCEREARREHGVSTSPESHANEVRESIRLTDANFERYVFHGDNPVLVYFGAPWCTSCREFAPIIEELAVQFEDRVVVGTVDIDAYPKIAKKFLIHAVPVLLLFQNGEFVTRWDGLHNREEIANKLRELSETVPEDRFIDLCIRVGNKEADVNTLAETTIAQAGPFPIQAAKSFAFQN